MWLQIFATAALAWYVFIGITICIGTYQIYKHFHSPPQTPIVCDFATEDVPHVTVIRPVQGLEPYLYECLQSTFLQRYPPEKLTVYFCVATRTDPSFSILEKLAGDYKHYDVKIFVEDEPEETSTARQELGPNPKIRNMSAAWRAVKGDLVWIVDCNVWVSDDACALMVDRLCGFTNGSNHWKYKFVHQLPLAIDVTEQLNLEGVSASGLDDSGGSFLQKGGARLDEMFLSTSHAKFYTAISTLAVAPCIVGKSNMFRKSHLEALTKSLIHDPVESNSLEARGEGDHSGIAYFSHNICEDHLIGDLLWKKVLPDEIRELASREGPANQRDTTWSFSSWGNHGIIITPPCLQPLANVSVNTYISRRTRWLRVRKFTVALATAVEPGTESLLANTFGTFGLLNCKYTQPFENPSPAVYLLVWLILEALWLALDRVFSTWLVEWEPAPDTPRPSFIKNKQQRKFSTWFPAWLGRELLAWPIWAWAVFGGTEVIWRGRRFRVGFDTKVHAIDDLPNGKAKRT